MFIFTKAIKEEICRHIASLEAIPEQIRTLEEQVSLGKNYDQHEAIEFWKQEIKRLERLWGLLRLLFYF